MAADVQAKWRTIAILTLRLVLGLAFLAIGATKLTGSAHTVEYFAAIGWGQWFRYLTGLLDITGAALLWMPRWTYYGATMLACTVGLATVISFTRLQGDPVWGNPQMIVAPLALTLLAALLARLARPCGAN